MNASFALEYAQLKLQERYPNGYKAIFEYTTVALTALGSAGGERKINATNQYYYLITKDTATNIQIKSDDNKVYEPYNPNISNHSHEHTGYITLKNLSNIPILLEFLQVSVVPKKEEEKTAALVALG